MYCFGNSCFLFFFSYCKTKKVQLFLHSHTLTLSIHVCFIFFTRLYFCDFLHLTYFLCLLVFLIEERKWVEGDFFFSSICQCLINLSVYPTLHTQKCTNFSSNRLCSMRENEMKGRTRREEQM